MNDVMFLPFPLCWSYAMKSDDCEREVAADR
jgi:hypothetical protein